MEENPTMAFSGVRISWLMLARKADFRRLAFSAFSLAASSSVMSSAELTIHLSFPLL